MVFFCLILASSALPFNEITTIGHPVPDPPLMGPTCVRQSLPAEVPF